MKFYILTLFPEMIEDALNTSILGRASKAGSISFEDVPNSILIYFPINPSIVHVYK